MAAACAEGNKRAQFELFERTKNKMFGLCLRFSGSRSEAEDLLQEGFIRVFRDIGHYRGSGSLEGWIRRIFIRTAIEDYHKRKNKLQASALDLPIPDFYLPDDFVPHDSETVIDILHKIPPGYRADLNLAVLEEKSHEEIGRELGITPSASRSQLTRAKAFLKKIIQKTLLLI